MYMPALSIVVECKTMRRDRKTTRLQSGLRAAVMPMNGITITLTKPRADQIAPSKRWNNSASAYM